MHRAVVAYQWRMVFLMHRTLSHTDGWWFYQWGMAIRWRRQPPKDGCIIIAPGWLAYLGSVAEEESTAEERLYKSRKIILASWVSRPAIGSGVPTAREMGRMRRIPARIRFAPRTGLRKSAVAPRRCRCGDGISTTALRRFSLGIACFVGKNTYLCLEKELNDEL